MRVESELTRLATRMPIKSVTRLLPAEEPAHARPIFVASPSVVAKCARE